MKWILHIHMMGKVLYTFSNPVMYGGKFYVLIEDSENQKRVLLQVSRYDYRTLKDKEGLYVDFRVRRFSYEGKLINYKIGEAHVF